MHIHLYVSTSLSSPFNLDILTHIRTFNLIVFYTHTCEHLLYNHCHCKVDEIESCFSLRFLFFVKFLVFTLLVQIELYFVEHPVLLFAETQEILFSTVFTVKEFLSLTLSSLNLFPHFTIFSNLNSFCQQSKQINPFRSYDYG